MKKYGFFTPFDELTENLKTIVRADEGFDDEAWSTGDYKIQGGAVVNCFAPTGLQGKLTEEELDYLTDCNFHTIRRFFEGWTAADYLAYCETRDAPPAWLKGRE